MKTPSIKDIRAAAAARRAQRERKRKLLIGSVVVVGLGAILTLWVLPPIARTQLQTRLAAALGRNVTVERVGLNPLTLTATIDHLQIDDRDGGLLARWDRLRVNVNALAMLRGRWGFDAIELDGFQGRVSLDAQGHANFADLLGQETGAAEAGESPGGWPVEISALAVRGARIDFSDTSRAKPFATTIGPVSFGLEAFHTAGDPQAPYDFTARTESGETLAWHGTLSATPLRSAGTLELGGVNLAKYAPYYADQVAFVVRDGALNVKADYEADLSGSEPDFRLRNAELILTQLALGAPGVEGTALAADRLAVTGVRLDLRQRAVAVARVEWQGGQAGLNRTAEGIDLVALLKPKAAESTVASAASGEVAMPWAVTVGGVVVDGLKVAWRDETSPVPVALSLASLHVTVEDLDLAHLDRPVVVGVTAGVGSGGTITVSGQTGLDPLRPALEVTVDALALPVFSGYGQQASGLRVADGRLDATVRVGSANDGLVFHGGIEVRDTRLMDAAGGLVAGWENLQVDGIDGGLDSMAISIESVRVVRPEGRVLIAADGTMNLAGLGPQGAPSAADEPVIDVGLGGAKPDAAPASMVRVQRVELVEARLSFADESLPRVARAALTDLSGTLTGLSSVEIGKAEVSLRGKVDGTAAVSITGALNPLGRPAYADLNVEMDRMDLVPVGGYVGKFAGYGLDRGRMTLKIGFGLKDRAIKSDTLVTLDGFTLGPKVDSPDAIKLPVGLAIALLKDAKGQIVIDLPIAGQLDDPEFRVGRVVWRVVTNLLTKAATAPFGLLGSMFGAKDDADLEQQRFAAGGAELTPAANEKLDTVAKALLGRPALTLTIAGQFAAAEDAAAMRPVQLEARLREEASAEALADDGTWREGARARALVARYQAEFGELPIDTAGVAQREAMAAAAVVEVAPVVSPAPAPVSTDPTIVQWLKRVFVGEKPTKPETKVAVAAEVATRVGNPADLPALSPVEIEARLLSRVIVADESLRELAAARAAAVRNHLMEAGVPAGRLVTLASEAGEARVRLDLR